MSPDLSSKTDRAGYKFLEGRHNRKTYAAETKSGLAFAGHRKEDYIDGDQNDPANDQNHLFGEHKASLNILTGGMAKFRDAGMIGSENSNKPEND